MNIYTAHYRYSGDDRLDITVKGNTPPGNVLAPTWEMVRGLQAQKISEWDYTIKYFSLLIYRLGSIGDSWRTTFDEMVYNKQQLTLVCFCKPQTFCHRVLAARMLEEMGYGRYLGERIIQ